VLSAATDTGKGAVLISAVKCASDGILMGLYFFTFQTSLFLIYFLCNYTNT